MGSFDNLVTSVRSHNESANKYVKKPAKNV